MADPTHFTTEQTLPLTLVVKDGRGRTVPIEGTPVAAVSDETVATAGTMKDNGDGSWSMDLVSVSASPVDSVQRLTITADADVSATVQEVVGVLDFVVDLDDRSKLRIISLVAGPAVDKTV